jgi:pimeloyl-ACP methyl ester carboxylesterase
VSAAADDRSDADAVLDAYKQRGGRYEELVFDECGHSPHIEREADYLAAIEKQLAAVG